VAHRLAIDLGTSHTVAVVRRSDEAPRPLLFDGSPLMPSAVFAEPPRLHVGRDAERMALVDPSRFEPHPKRRVDEGSVLLGNTEFTVVDMLAALLRRVSAEAAQAGVPASADTVLTCPADWATQRRNVLLAAARTAGLGPVRLVEEPVAAATYCMDVLQQQVGVGGVLTVFDFGGGTLDVSVLRRDPDGLRVLSVGGLDDLGGVDIDAALVGHLGQLISLRSPRVWQRLNNPGPQSEQRERRQFWDEVRGAKEMLSRTASAPVHVPGMDGALHLTREELERVAGPLVDRAVDETRRVLQRAGVDPRQLAGLFLVGGSSRIPLVASRLHGRFGLAPAVPEQPELPVAYGALIVAGGRGGPSVPASMPAPAPVSTPPRPTSGVPVSTPPRPTSGVPVSPADGSGGFPASYPPMPSVPSAPPFGAPTGPPPGAPGGPPRGVPTGPPPGFPPSGFAPPGPGAPGMPPRRPTLPPRRRSGTTRIVVLLVVVALLVFCGWGVFAVYKGVKGAFTAANNAVSGNGGTGNGGTGGTGGGRAGSAGDLKQIAALKIPGEGGLATTVGPDTVFYAGVGGGKIEVVALNTADGKEKWKVSVPAEPENLRLRQTGDLLLVDGERAASHAGKDIRAVLDAKTGVQKRLDVVGGQRVVAYFGGDAVVENDRPHHVARVDLATGAQKWKFDVKDSIGSPDYWAVPSLVPAPDGPQAGQGVGGRLPWTIEGETVSDWSQALAADPAAVVAIDEDAGKVSVLDAGTGKAKLTQAVPLNAEKWTVYAGFVVGVQNDKVSPGQTKIAGYGLDNLGERFKFPLPAGSRVERIKPCGPQHVCVAYSGTGGDWITLAVDLKTGQEAWRKTAKFGDEPDWFLMGPGLVYGKESFGHIGAPQLCDPLKGETTRGIAGGTAGVQAMAGAGRRVAVSGVRSQLSSTVWTVATVDLGTGKTSSALDLGAQLPTQMSMWGDVVAAVAKDDRRLLVARAPEAGK
jgi:molecular chaperone HscA